jgi:hypothetical protein
LVNQKSVSMKTAKALNLAFILTIVVYVVAVIILNNTVGLPIVGIGEPVSTQMQIAFGVVSVLSLVVGYGWPILIKPRPGFAATDVWVTAGHIVRITMFETVAIYGLVLAITVDSLLYSLTLMLIAELALIRVFPNEQRWARWKGEKPA